MGLNQFLRMAALALLVALPPATEARARQADTTKTREVELSADLLQRDATQQAQLTGNVRLRQGDTRLWSRRATDLPERNEILFSGDVVIVERGDTLVADEVLYNKQTKTGRAAGHVRLSDGDVVVQAPSGLYFTKEKRARFDDGVTLVDSTSVLTSRAGQYWSDEKRAEFYGDVHLDADRTTLASDSITYFRETEVAIARGHVFIERIGGDEDGAAADSSVRTLLLGDWAHNDNRATRSRLRGHPLMVQLRTDSTGTDTLLIRALRIETLREDSLQRLVAVDSVQIWQRDFAAVSDSLVYERFRGTGLAPREESRLFRRPMAWFQRAQVSGDTLRLAAHNDRVDSLFARGRAFVAQLDTLLDRIQQLRGQRLTGLFEQDSLRSLRMEPNAEAIYYMSDDDDRRSGAVRTSADRIIFTFAGDALESTRVLVGVEGTYYPEELLPPAFQLDGFQWLPERRPSRIGLLKGVDLREPVKPVGLARIEEGER